MLLLVDARSGKPEDEDEDDVVGGVLISEWRSECGSDVVRRGLFTAGTIGTRKGYWVMELS